MDDDCVYLDYHRDEVKKRDKEIAALKQERDHLKAAEWLASAQLSRLRRSLEASAPGRTEVLEHLKEWATICESLYDDRLDSLEILRQLQSGSWLEELADLRNL